MKQKLLLLIAIFGIAGCTSGFESGKVPEGTHIDNGQIGFLSESDPIDFRPEKNPFYSTDPVRNLIWSHPQAGAPNRYKITVYKAHQHWDFETVETWLALPLSLGSGRYSAELFAIHDNQGAVGYARTDFEISDSTSGQKPPPRNISFTMTNESLQQGYVEFDRPDYTLDFDIDYEHKMYRNGTPIGSGTYGQPCTVIWVWSPIARPKFTIDCQEAGNYEFKVRAVYSYCMPGNPCQTPEDYSDWVSVSFAFGEGQSETGAEFEFGSTYFNAKGKRRTTVADQGSPTRSFNFKGSKEISFFYSWNPASATCTFRDHGNSSWRTCPSGGGTFGANVFHESWFIEVKLQYDGQTELRRLNFTPIY